MVGNDVGSGRVFMVKLVFVILVMSSQEECVHDSEREVTVKE